MATSSVKWVTVCYCILISIYLFFAVPVSMDQLVLIK